MRRIALFLTAAAAALCFCACGGKTELPAETAEPTEPHVSSAALATRGYEFVMKLPFAGKYIPDDSESGRELAALYERIERELGVTVTVGYSAGVDEYIPAALGEAKYADVIGLRAYEIYSLAKRKYILSTDDTSLVRAGLNVNDSSRFYNDVAQQVTYAGKQWSVQIPSEYDLPQVGSFLLCNEGILSLLGEGNIRNLAETGKWTWQQYIAFSKAAAALGPDISGSGVVDRMGVLFSCGGQLVTEREGVWSITAGQVPMLKGIGSLVDALSPKNNADRATSRAELFQNFIEGKLAFLALNGETLTENPLLLSASGGVGVLPLPKNSAFDDYCSLVSDYCGLGFLSNYRYADYGVPVLNALAAGLYREDWKTLSAGELGFEGREAEILCELVISNSVFSKADYDARIENSVNELLEEIDASTQPYMMSMAIQERISELYLNVPR